MKKELLQKSFPEILWILKKHLPCSSSFLFFQFAIDILNLYVYILYIKFLYIIILHIIYVGDRMYYPVSALLIEFLILSVVESQDSYGYEISQTVKIVADIKESTLYIPS